MSYKSKYSGIKVEELLDSIPIIASDLESVINTYATLVDLNTKETEILNQVVSKASFTLEQVKEIPDIIT